MTVIRHLTHKSIRPEDNKSSTNVLSFFYDGFFDRDLASCANIYGNIKTSINQWYAFRDYNPLNLYKVEDSFKPIGNDITFDCILCNDRTQQYDKALKFARAFHIPLVIVDHFTYTKQLNPAHISQLSQSHAQDFVACNKALFKKWGNKGSLIPYSIDIPETKEKDIDFLIGGTFSENEIPNIKGLVDIFKAQVIGNNESLCPRVEYYSKFQDHFQRAKVFINLANHTGLSRELLTAMACGCGIVTNRTDNIESILIHKENALVVDNINEIVTAGKSMYHDYKLRKRCSEHNISVIKTEFNRDNFINKWNNFLINIKNKAFIL